MIDTAVAIVGLACRYPGAPDVAAFWRQIHERRTAFRPPDDRRWRYASLLGRGRDPYTTLSTHVAWIDDVERFAADEFGIAANRAEAMDPQQRLTLETVREALIDAGLEAVVSERELPHPFRRPAFDRERAATFIGASVSEYASLMATGMRGRQIAGGEFGTPSPDTLRAVEAVRRVRAYTIPGSLLSMTASGVAQQFDLRGPALSLDAACASSLVSVALAVQHLRAAPQGSGAIALAGGVYLNLVPDNCIGFSRIGVLAREACRPFDAAAEGFILGEGVGVAVLKRLDDALADGDRIYAVIRDIAWNSDGAGEGPMTPTLRGQVAVLRAAMQRTAGVGYIECHGTGTITGDAVELAALREVVGPAALGSIKANIGHTLTAAGIAGLMRAALAVYRAQIPPQAGFDQWHPNLAEHAAHFDIPTAPRNWDGERRALVASFGFGGINCAAVLEAAPAPLPLSRNGGHQGERPSDAHVLACSAPTEALLREHLEALDRRLAELTEDDVEAVACTLAARKRHAWEASWIARTLGEARAGLHSAVPRQRTEAEEPSQRAAADAASQLAEAGEASERAEAGEASQRARANPCFRRIVDLPAPPLERGAYWIVGPRG